jgi:cysteine desulfuration protein SufE
VLSGCLSSPCMTLARKQQVLIADLSRLRDPQQRLSYVVGRGRCQAPLDPALKRDEFRVEGCLSKLWFVPQFKDGQCHFRSDSDSAIVKGIAAMLCEFYSGHTPEEIVECDPTFFRQVGVTQHLTPNRRNSLSRLWDRIREFAEESRNHE